VEGYGEGDHACDVCGHVFMWDTCGCLSMAKCPCCDARYTIEREEMWEDREPYWRYFCKHVKGTGQV
jgi:hypothetical protein